MPHFSLALFPRKRTEYGEAIGRITIGDFSELFHVSLEDWGPPEYRSQWERVMRSLELGSQKGLFIASLEAGDGRLFFWRFRREGSDLLFRNGFRLIDNITPQNAEELAKAQLESEEDAIGDEDDALVSEWRISINGLTTSVELIN